LGFQGGLMFKAHRLLCHSTLGSKAIKKKKKGKRPVVTPSAAPAERAVRKGGDGVETAATPVAVIALTAPARSNLC